jgi:hypothetical protein
MEGGYVALLDVLGFSALVGGDPSGEKIRRYLDCLRSATAKRKVDFVVFSDSIVLTSEGDSPESLITIAEACSRLMADLLNKEIPLRGAIACGQYFRSRVANSVFVAGRAVIDAYQFEQAQNWIGIMLAPSALARVPDLGKRCRVDQYASRESLADLRDRISWAAHIQPWGGIPFRASSPLEQPVFDGFAVVPMNGALEPSSLHESLKTSLGRLAWLRSLAPSPSAQQKYYETTRWLTGVHESWLRISLYEAQVKNG